PAHINYHYADTKELTIHTGGASGNVIGVWENGVPNYLISQGPASVNIGDGDVGVQGILGTLNIDNPSFKTTIYVDDYADTTARTSTVGSYTVNGDFNSWGYIADLAQQAHINYHYARTNHLTINTGKAANNVTGVWENGVP